MHGVHIYFVLLHRCCWRLLNVNIAQPITTSWRANSSIPSHQSIVLHRFKACTIGILWRIQQFLLVSTRRVLNVGTEYAVRIAVNPFVLWTCNTRIHSYTPICTSKERTFRVDSCLLCTLLWWWFNCFQFHRQSFCCKSRIVTVPQEVMRHVVSLSLRGFFSRTTYI